MEATNEAFFSKTLSQAKTSIASGDNTWKVFRSWTLPGSDTNYKVADDEQVVVKVLKSGTETQHPLSTDSVLVTYRARLLPSTTYPMDWHLCRLTLADTIQQPTEPLSFQL